MSRFMMLILVCAGTLGGSAVMAQPSLDSLWPNSDGMRFDYEYSYTDLQHDVSIGGPAYLALNGYASTPGGEAQQLIGEHPYTELDKHDQGPPALPGLLAAVWRARVDLRPAIEARYSSSGKRTYWQPLFLHDGYFMKTADRIEMWQDGWTHSTWTYLDGAPQIGTTFVHQLVPELADDIYLHGMLTSISATVETVSGTYHDAVKMDYVIDLGISELTDESGTVLSMVHSEIRGHVFYVPEIGPVEMLQEMVPYVWVDCGDIPCSEEMMIWVGQVMEVTTLSLSRAPVANTDMNWSDIKAMYR